MLMVQLMLLPDLTSPTPYAKSCHGKEYRVQGSREREGGRFKLDSKLVSTRFTGRQRSWSRELPRGCHVSGGLGVGRANKAQQSRQAGRIEGACGCVGRGWIGKVLTSTGCLADGAARGGEEEEGEGGGW
jgi:hypothetical protein